VITSIILNGRKHNVKPDEPPLNSKELNSFCYHNDAPVCFFKSDGGWYKVIDNNAMYVIRTLYLLTLREWLEIALNDNFVCNIRMH